MVRLTSATLTLCVLVLVGCSQKQDPPKVFGVSMGDPLSSLADVTQIKQDPQANFALVNFAFKPHEPNAVFSQYAAFVTTHRRVCQIKAQTPGAPSGQAPAITSEQFGAVKDALIEKYGRPADIGFGAYSWERRSAGVKLPDTIDVVMLHYMPDSGDIAVTYNFSNFSDCAKENRASGL